MWGREGDFRRFLPAARAAQFTMSLPERVVETRIFPERAMLPPLENLHERAATMEAQP